MKVESVNRLISLFCLPQDAPANQVKRQSYWKAGATVFLFILAIAHLTLFLDVLFPYVLINKFLVIRQNSDGSYPVSTGHWINLAASIHYDFFLFNVTNRDEVIYDGAQPRVLETGPYSYRCREVKDNVTFSSDGTEVSYLNRRFWVFDPSRSCSDCSEADPTDTINVANAAVVFLTTHQKIPWFMKLLLQGSLLATGTEPFKTIPAGGFIFRSYNDPLITLQNSPLVNILKSVGGGSVFGLRFPDYKHPGLMPMYNHSHEPHYVVKTGKDDYKNLGKIVSYGESSEMDWFEGEARRLNHSTDGSFGQPFLQATDEVNVFRSYTGRSFPLKLVGETDEHGPRAFVYHVDRDAFDGNTERNRGMRYENLERINYVPSWPSCNGTHVYRPNEDRCSSVDCSLGRNFCDDCCDGSHYNSTYFIPPGFIPLRVFPGRRRRLPFSFFTSSPHMLWVPEEARPPIKGLEPDEEKHRPVEWCINPTLGAAIHANVRYQASLPMFKSDIIKTSELTTTIIPTFWVSISVDLDHEVRALIMLGSFWAPLIIRMAGLASFLGAAIIFASLLIVELGCAPQSVRKLFFWYHIEEQPTAMPKRSIFDSLN